MSIPNWIITAFAVIGMLSVVCSIVVVCLAIWSAEEGEWSADEFSLDLHRIIEIDGHPHVIVSFQSEYGSYGSMDTGILSVDFMREGDYLAKVRV